MNREARPSAGHHWPWVLGIVGAAVAAAAMVFWFRGPTFWADGRGVHVADSQARLREVLWSPPAPLDARFDGEAQQQQYEPCLSPDGSEFYFVRGKPGHDANIYVSYRKNNQWTTPTSLDAVNSLNDDLGPRLTPDGQFLLFYSDRAGGYGGYDIWAAHRFATGWDKPFNLGPRINGEFNEFSPDPTPDGRRLIFATNRKSANQQQRQAWKATIRETVSSDYDLWMADLESVVATTEPSSPTTAPSTRPSPAAPRLVYKNASEIRDINTPWVEGASCMSPAGDFLYFASNRPGGYGNFDIWRSRISIGEAGQWTFGPAENVGPQINTADNETDPAMALNGYRMYLSSDRGNDSGIYRLLISDSREVYPAHESRRTPHLGLSVWLLIGSLLLLAPLLLFLRGWDENRLNMLQRCLLLSLLVHVGICFALSLMKVTTQVYHYVREETGGGGSVTVALAAPGDVAVGYAIRQQSSSDLPVASTPPAEVARSAVPVERFATREPMAVQLPEARTELPKGVIRLEVPSYSVRAASTGSAQVSPGVVQTDSLTLSVAQPKTFSGSEASPQAASAQPAQSEQPELAKAMIAGAATPKMQPLATPAAPSAKIDVGSEVGAGLVGEAAHARIDPIVVSNEPVAVVPAANSTAEIEREITGLAMPAKRQAAVEASPSSNAVGAPETPEPASPFAEIAGGRHAERPMLSAMAVRPAARGSGHDPGPQLATMSGRPTSRPSLAFDLPAALVRDDVPPAPDVMGVGTVRNQHRISHAPAANPIAAQPVAPAARIRALATASSDTQQADHATRLDAPLPPASSVKSALASLSSSLAADRASIQLPPKLMASAGPATPATFGVATLSPPASISLPANLLARANSTQASHPIDTSAPPLAPAIAMQRLPKANATDREPIDMHLDISAVLTKSLKTHDASRDSRDWSPPELTHRLDPAFASIAPDTSAAFSLPLPPPRVGLAAAAMVPDSPFKMRAPEVHRPLLETLGGTKESEGAVDRALAYLASVQEEEGRWGYITDNRSRRRRSPLERHPHDMACTGLAILAFLAQDHRPDKRGPYQDVVSKGLDFLVSEQLPDGDLRGPMRGGGADQGNMYDQGIATFALAEAAAMSHDPRYTEAALSGAKFIVAAQDHSTGGWRYVPGESGDSSVFGWQVMALHSAEQVGFHWPAAAHHDAIKYIRIASSGEHRMLAAYQPYQGPSAPMTAEIAFCRMLLGQQLTEDEAREVGEYLGNQPPGRDEADIYYWYYGSLCMMQMQNDAWQKWNTRTRDLLVHAQHKVGSKAGYWDGMRWGDRGGRVFTTAMATLTLEVYYRYLPMQKKSEPARE